LKRALAIAWIMMVLVGLVLLDYAYPFTFATRWH
jgi:hypothetical protein